ncbi:MAG: hypothetical protein ACRDF4_06480 [Rhabdochlamydiaceae bacterium]
MSIIMGLAVLGGVGYVAHAYHAKKATKKDYRQDAVLLPIDTTRFRDDNWDGKEGNGSYWRSLYPASRMSEHDSVSHPTGGTNWWDVVN